MRDLSKRLHTCLFLGVFFLSVFLANTALADEELSISETAQKYLGVPYLTDGQEPNQGFSTGGLIQYVFKGFWCEARILSKYARKYNVNNEH